MYELVMTLNEPVEDILTLQQGDSPVLQVTLYDWDGSAWDDGYTATLIVGRNAVDGTEWDIAESACVPFVENVFCFELDEITNTIGNYVARVHVHITDEATPLATPEDLAYSFLSFKMEVI